MVQEIGTTLKNLNRKVINISNHRYVTKSIAAKDMEQSFNIYTNALTKQQIRGEKLSIPQEQHTSSEMFPPSCFSMLTAKS